MTNIHIRRPHHLGLEGARDVAGQWIEQAERNFDIACLYANSPSGDEVQFSRSGVDGLLTVSAEYFELNARLGFLLAAFKDRIEAEITKNLDQLLSQQEQKTESRIAPSFEDAQRSERVEP